MKHHPFSNHVPSHSYTSNPAASIVSKLTACPLHHITSRHPHTLNRNHPTFEHFYTSLSALLLPATTLLSSTLQL